MANTKCKNIRFFWIWFIIAMVFLILGTITMANLMNQHYKNYSKYDILFLTVLWLLSFILIFIITYYAFISNQCRIMTTILFFIIMLFLVLWAVQFINSTLYANISIIVIIATALAFIYLAPFPMLFLGILFLFIWLFIFAYTNNLLCTKKMR